MKSILSIALVLFSTVGFATEPPYGQKDLLKSLMPPVPLKHYSDPQSIISDLQKNSNVAELAAELSILPRRDLERQTVKNQNDIAGIKKQSASIFALLHTRANPRDIVQFNWDLTVLHRTLGSIELAKQRNDRDLNQYPSNQDGVEADFGIPVLSRTMEQSGLTPDGTWGRSLLQQHRKGLSDTEMDGYIGRMYRRMQLNLFRNSTSEKIDELARELLEFPVGKTSQAKTLLIAFRTAEWLKPLEIRLRELVQKKFNLKLNNDIKGDSLCLDPTKVESEMIRQVQELSEKHLDAYIDTVFIANYGLHGFVMRDISKLDPVKLPMKAALAEIVKERLMAQAKTCLSVLNSDKRWDDLSRILEQAIKNFNNTTLPKSPYRSAIKNEGENARTSPQQQPPASRQPGFSSPNVHDQQWSTNGPTSGVRQPFGNSNR